MNHKISIITPAKLDTDQKIEWIKEAMLSAQKQTYNNWEMVIVNDGNYGVVPNMKDDRIKIITLDEPVGTAIARNTAAHYAEGPLLLPLDADDILHPKALEVLYNKWEEGKFVYGNLQLLVGSGNGWDLNRQTEFPPFDCSNILNLSGALPVTALHSKEDHIKIGGWKSILEHGLEDVEYWVAMLEQCVMGVRVEDIVLYYRKHRSSRSEVMKTSGELGAMRSKISKLHKNIYGGKEMPCPGGCGKKRRIPTTKISSSSTQTLSVATLRTLEAYPDSDLVQLRYNGPRKAPFGIIGGNTEISYRIKGTNDEFLVHTSDLQRFGGEARTGPLFLKVEPKTMFVHNQKVVELPTKEETFVPPTPSAPEIAGSAKKVIQLEELGQNDNITKLLRDNGVTVEKIANEMKVGDLRKIKGIGPSTELKITIKAKDLYFS